MDLGDARISQLLADYFGLAPASQAALAGRLDVVALPGGEWLFHQDDPGDALYLLVRGRLQAWQERESGAALAAPRLIGTVVPGDSVGELALLTGAPRAAGVRASRDSQLLRITRAAFEELAGQHPALGLRLASRTAALVARSGAKAAGPARSLSAVTLLPLDAEGRTGACCEKLARELAAQPRVRVLTRQSLPEHGAPEPWPDDQHEPPASLVSFIHHLEEAHRLLVFRCEPGESAWARFALRQSDLVVLVADSGRQPALESWERRLELGRPDALLRQALVLLQRDSTHRIESTSAWREARRPEFHLHVRADRADDIARVARVLTGRATGLVLGAGASRGFAHLGVYRALCEANIAIDWVAGASIGAIMGAMIAFDWGPQHACNVARAAFVGGKPFGDFTLPLVSLLAGRRMRRLIEGHAAVDIEDLPLPFFCLSSRLDDGTPTEHRSGSLARALRATASMPGILPPTVVDGHLAVDGSVLNSLPVDLMWREPVGRVIAVTLTANRSREVSYAETPGAWRLLLSRLLPFGPHPAVPALMTILLKSTELATLRTVEEQGTRASLLLRPEVHRFGLTEVRAFDRIVEAGYRCAVQALQGWPGAETP